MLERTDYLKLMQRRADDQKAQHVHSLRTEMPRILDMTHKAQMVIDHPGWQQYADQLTSSVAEIRAKRVATAERMVTGTEMGHDLELLKINLNAMDAEMAGLQYALSLIPDTIQAGASLRAAAGSIAG